MAVATPGPGPIGPQGLQGAHLLLPLVTEEEFGSLVVAQAAGQRLITRSDGHPRGHPLGGTWSFLGVPTRPQKDRFLPDDS